MKTQEKNIDKEIVIFNYNEILETLEDKLNESTYITKSNWSLCIILIILTYAFFSFSTLLIIPKFIKISSLLTSITFFLSFSIFFIKILIQNKMKNDIISLMNELLKLKEINIRIETTEIFISKITQGIYGSYLIDDKNIKHQILCPFVPDYIINKKINVLIYENKILDFFYF